MPQTHLAGGRIRARRIERGIKQGDLARQTGISASYLNLIEHNKRRIGGDLLRRVALELDVRPETLSLGAGQALLEGLKSAAAGGRNLGGGMAGHSPEPAAEFAQAFPGWAELTVLQNHLIERLERRLDALTDRLAHDPRLASSLNDVISTATAIRSAADILVDGGEIDADWQRRFHKNIHIDSLRLAEASRALAGYLELDRAAARRAGAGESDAAGDGADGTGVLALSASEEFDRFVERLEFHVPELEGSAPDSVADVLAERGDELTDDAARALAADWLTRYRALAQRLPLATFAAAAVAADHDPFALSAQLGVSPALVLYRLATLPSGPRHPRMGLAVCDRAGAVSELKPVPGFVLPRSGAGCAIWPLFGAITQPGRPLSARVLPHGEAGAPLLVHAVAEDASPARPGEAPLCRGVMLVRSDPPADAAVPQLRVGPACRICPARDCAARREPPVVLASATRPANRF